MKVQFAREKRREISLLPLQSMRNMAPRQLMGNKWAKKVTEWSSFYPVQGHSQVLLAVMRINRIEPC